MIRLWIRVSSPRSAPSSSGKSFSQAAERLGVTQPAVSLQIRSLEQRLGRQLLDRSGRRVEPTEAGHAALPRRAAAARARAAARSRTSRRRRRRAHAARSSSARRPGRGDRRPAAALRVPAARTRMSASRSRLRHADRRRPVARRELELGIVGAARRHRVGRVRAVLPRRGRARLPAGHRFAGRTVSLDELRDEPLIRCRRARASGR